MPKCNTSLPTLVFVTDLPNNVSAPSLGNILSKKNAGLLDPLKWDRHPVANIYNKLPTYGT